MGKGIRAAAAMGLVALAACGGGGGGASDSTGAAPETQRENPLQIDRSNRLAVVQLSMVYAESLLALAHDLGSWIRLDLPAAQGQRVSCGAEGTRLVRLDDRDGNGRLSAGDRLSLQLDRCRAAASDNVFTGLVQIGVDATTAAQGWSGHVDFGDAGLGFQAGGVSFAWRGVLGANVEIGAGSPVLRRIALDSAPGEPLYLQLQSGDTARREAFTGLRLRHEASLELAGSRTQLEMRLASDVLRGSVLVQTPVALDAYLDRFAHAGRVRIQGASGDTVEMAAADGRQAGWLSAWVDGQGQADTPTGVLWRELVAGYLWWGTGAAPAAYAQTRELGGGEFSAQVVGGEAFDAGSPELTLLFSGVPAAGTRPLAWLQHEGAVEAGGYFGPPRIETAGTLSGAVLRLRPAEPLAPGQQYRLFVVNQLPSGELDAVRDGRGGALNGLAATWTVRTALTAPALLQTPFDQVLLPGRPITLSAQPAAQAQAYRWRQVEGPPLRLSDETGLQTTLSLPPDAAGAVVDAVVELAVTSSTGAVDRTRRTVKVVPSQASTTLLQVQASPGAGPGRNVFAQASAFGHWRPEFNALLLSLSLPGEPGLPWVEMAFFMAPGQPLAAGRYTIVPSSFAVPRTGPDVTANWSFNSCSDGLSGSFTIHEVSVSAERAFDGFPLQQAAIDFDLSCRGGPPVVGSLRFFSSVPLRATAGGP